MKKFVLFLFPVILCNSVAFGSDDYKGLNDHCYSVGFSHGSNKADVDPVGEGIDAFPCTLNEKANSSYGRGYQDGMECKGYTGISSGDEHASLTMIDSYPTSEYCDSSSSQSVNHRTITHQKYNRFYPGSGGIWDYQTTSYLPYCTTNLYLPNNTCQCIWHGEGGESHDKVCLLHQRITRIYTGIERQITVPYIPNQSVGCQCIYQFQNSHYNIHHASVCIFEK